MRNDKEGRANSRLARFTTKCQKPQFVGVRKTYEMDLDPGSDGGFADGAGQDSVVRCGKADHRADSKTARFARCPALVGNAPAGARNSPTSPIARQRYARNRSGQADHRGRPGAGSD